VDAGHILGSAMVSLRLNLGFAERSLTFTGDLGRRGVPFLHEFGSMPEADLVISESTYGGRRHQTLSEMTDAVSEVVRHTAERGGKLLIPAFSLGRTQLVVHYLSKWVREGRIPRLPIWVDGSLAPDMAEIHRDHANLLIPDADLHGPGVEYIRSREESEIASTERGPAVIIAPSGMCDGGRVLHHLKQHLDDPRCTILLVSYQAPHTLGRQLLEPRPTVRFHGRAWNLWAEVVEVDGFSGHAGHDDLLAAIGPLAGRAKKVRLVHGEMERAEVLAKALGEAGFGDVAVPERGETVTLA
jgi:metallo-beta-lactamase family protein